VEIATHNPEHNYEVRLIAMTTTQHKQSPRGVKTVYHTLTRKLT